MADKTQDRENAGIDDLSQIHESKTPLCNASFWDDLQFDDMDYITQNLFAGLSLDTDWDWKWI